MDFGTGCVFDDDLFGDVEAEKKSNRNKQQEPYAPKTCSKEWYVSKQLSNEEKHSLEDCQLIKYQADLLFFRKDYKGALEKYEERLQFLCNLNNNSMLREVHGSIINCHLKLGSVEKAVVHVKKILGTTGNPFDSYIYLLAHKVYLITGDVQESGRALFTALTINPWYVGYWLMLFQYLHTLHLQKKDGGGEAIQLSDNVQLKSFNEQFLKLLLVHTEFIFRENMKSNTNSGNLKNDSTQEKIKEFWGQLSCEDKASRKEWKELYHVMSRSNKADDVIRAHPCFVSYQQVLAKPLSEAKNF